jgi:Zn-dependent peptidase ImmA (M78 family)
MVFGVQVFCHQGQQEWQANKLLNTIPAAVAYYKPEDASIHLGPRYCKQLATPTGAWVLAHELGHHWQQSQGLPFDEKQANRLADRNWSRTLERICEVRKCGITIKLGG